MGTGIRSVGSMVHTGFMNFYSGTFPELFKAIPPK